MTLAAFHTSADKGFEGLRVHNIAQQVGINGATLHHYFPTKEDLIQSVVEYTITRLRKVMQSMDRKASPLAPPSLRANIQVEGGTERKLLYF